MGIPKFFAWMSRRYNMLLQLVDVDSMPLFDNLYLDANGIIHQCSHDNNGVTTKGEQEIFDAIMLYIDYLFMMIRPRKCFFIAVDGVAPRAKMNQQRQRRFKSAQELAEERAIALKRNEIKDDDVVFDSNCITPGTEFMDRLDKFLQCSLAAKVSNCLAWRNVKVYYSGHQAPGEGEHKIMSLLRQMRANPDYDPAIKHCLYGLDSDLIFLGLVSHEAYFTLLREEARRAKTKVSYSDASNITWYFLHMSLFRDAINMEFRSVSESLKMKYDLDRIIDDWILINFIIGNDFIPSLPGFYVGEGTMGHIWEYYKKYIIMADGYLNDSGKIRLPEFLQFLKVLSEFDLIRYKESSGDSFIDGLRGLESNHSDDEDISLTEEGDVRDGDMEDEEQAILEEFNIQKKLYYTEKLGFTDLDNQVPKLCTDYMKMLQWALFYYYKGCQCWNLYFPYHYGPYVSDLFKIPADTQFPMTPGKPAKPFEQLMSVLPPASSDLLPKSYQPLLTNPDNRLGKFYPTEFATDKNDKIDDFEAIVLIPFLNEAILREYLDALENSLEEGEKERNTTKPTQIFSHSSAPFGFLDVDCETVDNEKVKNFSVNEFDVLLQLAPAPRKPVKVIYHPAFPRLNKRYDAEQVLIRQRCNFHVTPKQWKLQIYDELTDGVELKDVFAKLIHQKIYINWPMLRLARVTGIIKNEFLFERGSCNSVEKINLGSEASRKIENALNDAEIKLNTQGFTIHRSNISLRVQLSTGLSYKFKQNSSELEIKEMFDPKSVVYVLPHECLLRGPGETAPRFPFSEYLSLNQVLYQGAKAFCLLPKLYGQYGTIIKNNDGTALFSYHSSIPRIPTAHILSAADETTFYLASELSSLIGVSAVIIARISGIFFLKFGKEKISFGFIWKNNKSRLETPGMTAFIAEKWMYSERAGAAICRVCNAFPQFFTALLRHFASDPSAVGDLDILDFWSEELGGIGTVKAIKDFIEAMPEFNVTMITINDERLESMALKRLEYALVKSKQNMDNRLTAKAQQIKVPLDKLYFSLFASTAECSADHDATYLLDVVSVVGLHQPEISGCIAVVIGKSMSPGRRQLEVMLDKPFPFCYSFSPDANDKRCFKVDTKNVLNITHQHRLMEASQLHGKAEQDLLPSNNNPSDQIKHPSNLQRNDGFNDQGHVQSEIDGSGDNNARSQQRFIATHSQQAACPLQRGISSGFQQRTTRPSLRSRNQYPATHSQQTTCPRQRGISSGFQPRTTRPLLSSRSQYPGAHSQQTTCPRQRGISSGFQPCTTRPLLSSRSQYPANVYHTDHASRWSATQFTGGQRARFSATMGSSHDPIDLMRNLRLDVDHQCGYQEWETRQPRGRRRNLRRFS